MSKIALQGDASGTGTFTIAAPNSNSNPTLTLPTSSGTVVVTGGAQTIEFAAGSAASPSITFTGDTNTGIFSPAADTIAFTEGGAEAMRIDSSGNVGIGVTPSAWQSIYRAAQFPAGVSVAGRNDGGIEGIFATNAFRNSAGTWTYVNNGVARRYVQEADGHLWLTAASGTAGNAITFTQAMTLDASGNLGVGTTSPESILHVAKASSGGLGAQVILDNTATSALNNAVEISFLTDGGASGSGTRNARIRAVNENAANGNANLQFWTWNGATDAERARITSGGEFYVAGTTDQGAYNIQCNGTGVWGAGAYVNGSDAQIKEDVAPIDSGLDVVTKLNPVTYRYKEDWSKDQSTQTGFIAQELLVALEGKNYVDGVVQQGGSEGYYSVAYQNIIPILTKAIQELKAITDAQATRIEALEAEVAALKGQ